MHALCTHAHINTHAHTHTLARHSSGHTPSRCRGSSVMITFFLTLSLPPKWYVVKPKLIVNETMIDDESTLMADLASAKAWPVQSDPKSQVSKCNSSSICTRNTAPCTGFRGAAKFFGVQRKGLCRPKLSTSKTEDRAPGAPSAAFGAVRNHTQETAFLVQTGLTLRFLVFKFDFEVYCTLYG
eukprot:3940637-Rhodomonas_salina.3